MPTGAQRSYLDYVSDLESRIGSDRGLREAIGGDFIAVGKLEYYLLRSLGLCDGDHVGDIGCGSGRLACQLAPFPGIRYSGFDVVPRLVEYASALCKRPDWTFGVTDGTAIPLGDEVLDYAAFFSVFTHLPHEHTFRYFLEAARTLRPKGCLVFSFIEFKVPLHWEIFIASVTAKAEDRPMNQYVDRDAIHAWADHSGFLVESIRPGDTPHIPIPEEIVFDNGTRQGNWGPFGQSVAVLRKK